MVELRNAFLEENSDIEDREGVEYAVDYYLNYVYVDVIETYGEDDIVALRTAFNDTVDGLHKDGEISDEVVENIVHIW